MPVLEALNNIVSQFGWALRYHYDTAGTYALTLYEPPRSTTTSLATIATSTYREVQKCAQTIADVRNSFALDYIPTTGGTATATATDSSSIAAYGTRFMRLAGDAVANIRTSGDATTMLTAVKADLSAPKLDHEVQLLYYWPAQAYDLYTFPANGAHYDSDQKLAVMSVKHEAKGGEITTTLQVRGSVIGAFADWLGKRIVMPLSGNGSNIIGIYWGSIVDAPTTVSGYGITDVYTKTAGDARYAYVGGSNASGTWGISITGSAGSVTNGVLTTGSYADPTWITSLAGSKITGNISGNAGTATTLATARTLWGQSFNGSAAVTGALSGVTTIAASGTATISSTTALAFSYAGNADLQLSNASGVFRIVNAAYTVAAMTVTQAGVVSAGSSFSGPLTGNVTGNLTGAVTGNASTATALATARAINGVNFDGTAAITVTAAAGTLSGATLASGVTASSLTSIGTLASLTVTGTVTAGGLVSTSDWTFQGAAGKTIYALNAAGTDYTSLTVNSGTFYIFAGTAAQGNAQRFSQTYNQATFTTPLAITGAFTGATTGAFSGTLAVTGATTIGAAQSTGAFTSKFQVNGSGGNVFVRDNGQELYVGYGGVAGYIGTAYTGSTLYLTSGSGSVSATITPTSFAVPGTLAISGAFTGATTGAFSGTVTNAAGNSGTVLSGTGATTGYQIGVLLANTSGQAMFAVNGATAAALLTGGTAYSTTVAANTNTPLDFGTNNIRRGGFSAAGAFDLTSTLAVTGAATFSSTVTLAQDIQYSSNSGYGILSADSTRVVAIRNTGVNVTGSFAVTGAATFSSTLGVTGSISANGVWYGNSKNAIDTSDPWLRLNDTSAFTYGVFIRSKLRVDGNIETNSGDYGYGLVGNYDATKFRTVYAMGSAYVMATDGTSLGSLYGLFYAYDATSGYQNVTGDACGHGFGVAGSGAPYHYFGTSGAWIGTKLKVKNNRVDIQGPGTTSSTYGLVVTSYGGASNNFWVNDAGATYTRANATAADFVLA